MISQKKPENIVNILPYIAHNVKEKGNSFNTKIFL
jgi:hypothetical protein